MIFSYVKGVEQQEDMQQLVEENKEQNMGATIKAHLKENHMGVCHSHNALCGCMFTSDAPHGGTEKEKSGLLVQMIQAIKMLPKQYNMTMNVVG